MPFDIPCPRFYYYYYSNRLFLHLFFFVNNLNLDFNDNFVYTSLFVQHVVFIFLMLLGNLKTKMHGINKTSHSFYCFYYLCVFLSPSSSSSFFAAIFRFFSLLLQEHDIKYMFCLTLNTFSKYIQCNVSAEIERRRRRRKQTNRIFLNIWMVCIVYFFDLQVNSLRFCS